MAQEMGKTILLVEDEFLLAANEKLQLQKYGYAVLTANTGEKAIELVKGNSAIDLILMDINLGTGIDGTQAAKKILDDHDIPILFLSSHMEPEIVAKTEEITSYGYVVKSSSITVLDASIKMAFKLFEAKQSESKSKTELRSHAQLLEKILDTFPGFVVWKDLNSVFLGCNKNLAQHVGVSHPSDLVGKRDADLTFHQEEIDSFLADDKLVMETGKPKLHFEEYEHLADGKAKYLDTCKYPLFGDDGKVSGVLVIGTDITEYKKAENELRNGEEKFKKAFHSSPVALGITDWNDGKFIEVNESFTRILGYSSDEIIGHTSMELGILRNSEDRPRYMNSYMKDGYAKNIDIVVWTKLGDPKTVTMSLEPIDIVGRACMIFMFYNITERKKAEAALIDSEQKYRLQFQNSKSYNSLYEVLTDKDGRPYDFRFVMVNHAYEKYVGKDAPELIGKTLLEVYPETEQYWIDKMAEAVLTGLPLHFEAYSKVMKTYTEISLFVPQDGYLSMTTEDISERKNAENALKAKSEEYEALNEKLRAKVEVLREAR